MLNKKITLSVEATTPFAFGEGPDVRHGVAITGSFKAPNAEILDDLAGDKTAGMRLLLANDQLPISGDVALKFTRFEDIEIETSLGKRGCEISGLSVKRMPEEDAAYIKVTLKMKDVTADTMGKVCMNLRGELSFTLIRNQTVLPFQKKDMDEGGRIPGKELPEGPSAPPPARGRAVPKPGAKPGRESKRKGKR